MQNLITFITKYKRSTEKASRFAKKNVSADTDF